MKHIIANWKMQLSHQGEITLAKQIAQIPLYTRNISVTFLPSFISIAKIAKTVKDTAYTIGAQDCFWQEKGAYTGEVSPKFLKDLGCKYVLIGHSERRLHLGESNAMIHRKVKTVVDNSLIPVLCVGESADERLSLNKDHIVRRQVELALENIAITGSQNLLIAYEPLWAIGANYSAKISEVVYMHQVIYQTLIDLFPKSIVYNNIFVLYGGSVNKKNIQDFLLEKVIDGVLVGNASLKYNEFAEIIQIANNLKKNNLII